jgi:hypothetical protein
MILYMSHTGGPTGHCIQLAGGLWDSVPSVLDRQLDDRFILGGLARFRLDPPV